MSDIDEQTNPGTPSTISEIRALRSEVAALHTAVQHLTDLVMELRPKQPCPLHDAIRQAVLTEVRANGGAL